MPGRVYYRGQAAAIIRNLAPETKAAIRRGIDELAEDPFLGKDLQEEFAGFRSHRVRRYRIIYRINESESSVDIYYVGPRRNVYEAFTELLRG